MTTPDLVENFFRHEYGKLVAVLSRRIGVQYSEDVEDAVQAALLSALESWPVNGRPDNPHAWLYRVANNKLLDSLRKSTGRRRILEENTINFIAENGPSNQSLPEDEIQDDLLRMLFLCCDAAIPIESQLVFALKTLCGFEVREIAPRLFTSEANVYKRLSRARARLRENPFPRENLSSEIYKARTPSVLKVLYLLFTEGYLSSNPDLSIRRELCEEAIRLAELLANHVIGQAPETSALLALMHLHLARLHSRQNEAGGLLLLEEQDRSLWEKNRIQIGLQYLSKSAQGETFSRYHAEAGIAAEHCLAASFSETRWNRIANCYELLERVSTSPLHTLNRAIAIAEWKSPSLGLELLENLEVPPWLSSSYQWTATLADLHRRCGNRRDADIYRNKAIKAAPTPAIRILLQRRLNRQSESIQNTANE